MIQLASVSSVWPGWAVYCWLKFPISPMFLFVPKGVLRSEHHPPVGRLNKKDGLTRYGNSHVKDKTS